MDVKPSLQSTKPSFRRRSRHFSALVSCFFGLVSREEGGGFLSTFLVHPAMPEAPQDSSEEESDSDSSLSNSDDEGVTPKTKKTSGEGGAPSSPPSSRTSKQPAPRHLVEFMSDAGLKADSKIVADYLFDQVPSPSTTQKQSDAPLI